MPNMNFHLLVAFVKDFEIEFLKFLKCDLLVFFLLFNKISEKML